MEEKDACKIHSYHVINDNLYLGCGIRAVLEDMAGEKEECYVSLPDSRITPRKNGCLSKCIVAERRFSD